MVGVGNMGGRIARRLTGAGYDVLAVDADASRIPACGATPAASLADLAGRCDVIMLSLPDSTVIEPVIRDPGGLLEHGRDGQIIVDLSTANPASTRALHKDLAARGVSNALGYGDMISNRVVDAFGDMAGGIRVAGQTQEG